MNRKLFIFIIFILTGFIASSQDTKPGHLVRGTIVGSDTLYQVYIRDIWIYPPKKFTNNREREKYSRYVAKVKKVYPIAVEARILLDKYEPMYFAIQSDRERKKMMKNLEKELLDKHKEDLKKWSISDGKILIKLIDRETDRSAYSLIQDFRGDFSAVFWQGIARLFKNNLKDGYDPVNEDRVLEEVVRKIESGYY